MGDILTLLILSPGSVVVTFTVYMKGSIEPEEFEATKSMVTMSITQAISSGMLGSLSVDPDSLQGKKLNLYVNSHIWVCLCALFLLMQKAVHDSFCENLALNYAPGAAGTGTAAPEACSGSMNNLE